jgi:hypothetical protein
MFDNNQIFALRNWTQTLIFCNTMLVPAGRYISTREDGEYEQALNVALEGNCPTAVYQPFNVLPFDSKEMSNVSSIVSCPFGDELGAKYSEDVFIAAGRHLYELLRGREAPLTSLSQMEAWEKLAKGKYDHRSWFFSRTG